MLRVWYLNIFIRIPLHIRKIKSLPKGNFYRLAEHLNISESQAEYLSLKHPAISKLTEHQIKNLVSTIHDLGYGEDTLLQEPNLFGMLPITLKYRHQVLQECGIVNISPKHLSSYLPIIKQKTVGDLKKTGELPGSMNVENRLAGFMTNCSTALTTLVYGDVNNMSLYTLRLKIIQRYLELIVELSSTEFYRSIKTYPTTKHRPLQIINETLNILQSQIMMPQQKLKANLYLLHADPENLIQIVYNFQSIGGIDIKEVIRLRPKIALKNYKALFEIRKILQDHNISNEAQVRCFDIYNLSPETIRERLEKAKGIPEFSALYHHPRFLNLILFNKTATKRLLESYSKNKKCVSLNILSGTSSHYQTFEKAPGDRFSKGKDLVFCISECLGSTYNMTNVHKIIKRHPFWINIPLIQIKYVYKQLSAEFTPDDIYHNCTILLYPWNKIKDVLQQLCQKNQKQAFFIQEHQILSKLNKKQKLSLVLYLLEKKHYFTGNGVWTEEKSKVMDTEIEKTLKRKCKNKIKEEPDNSETNRTSFGSAADSSSE